MKKALLFLLVIPQLLIAQHKNWSSIEVVNTDASEGYNRPRISISEDQVPNVVWGKKSNLDVYISSKRSGSFTSPMKLNPNGMTVFAQDWAGPEIASFGKNVVVAFKSQPENKGFIYTVYSKDGGTTFGDTVRASKNNWTRFASPAIDQKGNPYVAFMEFDSGFVDPQFSVARSLNGGNSYAPSVDASAMAPNEVCDCCPPLLWADTNRIALFFRNNDNNIRDIWASISTDQGTSFSKTADIDLNDWVIFSCPSTGPDAVVGSDSMIVVWASGASGSSRINLGTADVNGLKIGRNLNIHPIAGIQNYPKIAGSGDTLGLVWQESASNGTLIKGLFSTSGVSGLLNAKVDTISELSEIFSNNPDVGYKNGMFHVVWQDNFNNQVKYRTLDVVTPLGIESTNLNTDIVVFPNPSKGLIQVKISASIIGAEFKMINNTGQLVKYQVLNNDLNSIDATSLEKGMYLLIIQNKNDTHTQKISIL